MKPGLLRALCSLFDDRAGRARTRTHTSRTGVAGVEKAIDSLSAQRPFESERHGAQSTPRTPAPLCAPINTVHSRPTRAPPLRASASPSPPSAPLSTACPANPHRHRAPVAARGLWRGARGSRRRRARAPRAMRPPETPRISTMTHYRARTRGRLRRTCQSCRCSSHPGSSRRQRRRRGRFPAR